MQLLKPLHLPENIHNLVTNDRTRRIPGSLGTRFADPVEEHERGPPIGTVPFQYFEDEVVVELEPAAEVECSLHLVGGLVPAELEEVLKVNGRWWRRVGWVREGMQGPCRFDGSEEMKVMGQCSEITVVVGGGVGGVQESFECPLDVFPPREWSDCVRHCWLDFALMGLLVGWAVLQIPSLKTCSYVGPDFELNNLKEQFL